MMQSATLPLPPRLNALYKTTRSGGFYKCAEGREYEKTVAILLRHFKPLRGIVECRIRFYFPKEGNDIDGRLKQGLDALKMKMYVDDAQIVRLIVEKYKDKINPRMEVLVAEIEQSPTPTRDMALSEATT